MPDLARVLPWLVLAFALAAMALGLYEWSNPPFSDQQLRTSLTDTWEVATSTTRVFIVVFLGLGSISGVLARKATRAPARIAAVLAAVACLLTLAIFLHNHIALTQRAAALTGQEFDATYGLF